MEATRAREKRGRGEGTRGELAYECPIVFVGLSRRSDLHSYYDIMQTRKTFLSSSSLPTLGEQGKVRYKSVGDTCKPIET